MNENKQRIPTNLRPDLSPDLERTETWLKAGVSPINGQQLVTRAQADHLLAYRQQLLATPAEPRDRWNTLHAYASDYLKQLPEHTRRETIVDELNTSIQPDKPFSTTIFLTPQQYAEWYRNGGEGAFGRFEGQEYATTQRGRRSRTIFTSNSEALVDAWDHFAQSYGLTGAQASLAARKKDSAEPMAATAAHQQRFALRKNGLIGGFFQYIHAQPDAYFSAVEAQIGRPVEQPDRTALLDSIATAMNAAPKGKGR